MRRLVWIFVFGLFVAGNASAQPLYLSVGGLDPNETATLGGLTIDENDVVFYNGTTASLVFDGGAHGIANIDALHVLSPTQIIISTAANGSLFSTPFLDGDLVLVNLSSSTASIFFSESAFAGNEDIDAVGIAPDGRILISAKNAATLGGLSFVRGDVVAYDPLTDDADLIFSNTNFTMAENVVGVHQFANGDLLITTATQSMIDGQTFQDGDVFRWDGTNASPYFLETAFTSMPPGGGIDAISLNPPIPEPASIVCFGLGLALVGGSVLRRRKSQS